LSKQSIDFSKMSF